MIPPTELAYKDLLAGLVAYATKENARAFIGLVTDVAENRADQARGQSERVQWRCIARILAGVIGLMEGGAK